ncbi:hypothetical protein GW937_02205 [Candidatus Kaiserbacteria bacterium]|nr:hypothetical protein [Candidatus Kaiserbacteria bacterium]
MNESEQLLPKKNSLLKITAIIGFFGVTILIAWLAIKLVGLAPSAFSSLASLAETLNERRLDIVDSTTDKWSLVVASDNTLTTVGVPVKATWNESKIPGTFSFSYACKEGVAVDLIGVRALSSITCATEYSLGNATEVVFSVDSEKDRYADLAYTISFSGTNDTKPRAFKTIQLTVVNNAIASNQESVPDIELPEETVLTTEPVITEIPTTPVIPTPETVPNSIPPKAITPTYTEKITYTTPVSDPNGRTDLGVRFIGTGSIINNSFVPGVVSQDKAGAIQFEVKNYGTKTSGTWDLSVTLPDGSHYESNDEIALKPNERAVMTIGFSAPKVATFTFIVIVDEANDVYALNDTLQQTVPFIR